MQRHKHRQQLDSFHLFHIVCYLKKREEVEIRHEPSWYEKEQLLSLITTQPILFDEVHIQQVSGPPMTSNLNEQSILQSTLVNLTYFKRNPDSTVIDIR